MDVVLVAGMWLDGSAWSAVVSVLEVLGHRPVALNLSGQSSGAGPASLDDQVEAVVAALDAVTSPVLIVGHSAAATLAWMAADARPDKVARVVMIGSFPSGDGGAYNDAFPVVEGVVPFPGWDAFDRSVVVDLDDKQRSSIEARVVSVPGAVFTGIVPLQNDKHFEVPVTVVCPEFSPAQAKEWVDSGALPELARVRRVELADIDSGHWPMFTRPVELAELSGAAADA
ncbi:alpha/beta hydrolase [Ferrimicrobium sp.]|uniref:alpha/beta fold hydrolase n=1 Tax=Ferrimicrobium sp. TaxID=2926050 RepID=UPI00262784D9|nr:alpha/beta hydrolase [Ferrimicrobium sp.]